MTVKYTVSEQDYIYFNMDAFFRLKNTVFFLKFIPPILFFIVIFTEEKFRLSIVNIVATCLFSFIWFIFYPKIMRKYLTTGVTNYFIKGKFNDFIGDQVLELKDDYMQESNSTIISQIKYSAIKDIYFGHGLFYIYLGSVRAIIIPSATFSNQEQKNDFFEILSQKTGLDFSNISQYN